MSSIPIAFYAPLKSPDHPAPSGDRSMARLLLRALRQAGYAPCVASRLRTWDRRGDPAFQDAVRREALREADRLIAAWLGTTTRPRLWFTYHVYYKAPDWIGPRVADALNIPYVIAEGSRAPRRAQGPWALGHGGAEAALDRADIIFVMTDADRPALERARPFHQRLVDLPPFLDLDAWCEDSAPSEKAEARPEGDLRLLTVAMMRPGAKLASYDLLARALSSLQDAPWSLDIVGDGEARPQVETLFAPFGERVRFHGRIEDRRSLRDLYQGAELFVWPAVDEAYGMALLEAQALGCPVVAGAYGGVASVVRHGRTGLLAPPADAAAFAEAVSTLLSDRARRRELADGARAFVQSERGLDKACAILRQALVRLDAHRVRA